MTGRLIEDIARAVDLGRVGIDLTFHLSSQDIGEHRAGVLMRGGGCRRGRNERDYAHLWIVDVCQRRLYQRFDAGRQDAVLKDEQLRGFRFAQVPKEPVDLHRAFVEEAARVVGPRRVRFDLVFYVALKDIREYRSFV